MKQVSNTTKLFFEYSFKGNGKYHTTERGSRHFCNSTYKNFYNKNMDCIDIKEVGNDAPRGGRTGNFEVVEFNQNFYTKWQWYIDFLAAQKAAVSNTEVAIKNEADSIAIDKKFISDVKEASMMKGIEKSNFSAHIFKAFLERSGIERIATDFWMVYRILKSRVAA